ncbi:ABC1-domain-containing protein [Ceraceosorus guamensis]|uniref:ABC1-domain-containing protein n=1 Tax=Ceraceosorus guamensis TaxID=1522189 RepID=A0A316W268_9BASI|nr:ABC1-domain-containing protein [Ceraceosorus guamensis]PWN43956.1 ABC1-domain-containing protein [Ceraceosorus guamensis]
MLASSSGAALLRQAASTSRPVWARARLQSSGTTAAPTSSCAACAGLRSALPSRHASSSTSTAFPTYSWKPPSQPRNKSKSTSAASSSSARSDASSSASEHHGKGSDSRPFRKTYPPPAAQPDPIVFDKPAVPNPAETQQAHAKFRETSRKGAVVAALLLGAAAAAWFTYSSVYADEAQGQRQHPALKGIDISVEEMEKRVKEAEAGKGAGNYTVIAVKRCTVIATAVALCVWDYRKTLNAKYESKEAEQAELEDCHLRSAHRLLAALQENGGLYIKLGQHMSSIALLPLQYTQTLRPLQDANEPSPLPALEAMFRQETGSTFEAMFSEFDANPLGVASLAQVHRAKDRKTGQWKAVKLMHPEVERFSIIDVKTVNVLVKWVKRIFPQFEFTWLAEEMNENLPLELDFRHEAESSRKMVSDFAHYKKTAIYIPKVEHVSKRVMVMEYIDGRRPDDLNYLQKHGIDRNRVSQELSRVFAQMLYMHGFFHGDPHAGNVLIRPALPGSRSPYNFELVLLDFGLTFDIDKKLRTDYARFWLALLSPSTPRVQKERRRLASLIANIPDELYPILESAITGKSGLEGSDPSNPHGVKGRPRASSLLDQPATSGNDVSDEEQEHIRDTVMAKEGLFVSILDMLRRVPRRMLMVLKINDLTRSLDYNLHTTHGAARPFIIAARYCALAVWDDDRENLRRRRKEQGLSLGLIRDWIGAWWNYFYFYRGLSIMEA